MDSLESVADDLYARPLGEFIAARNAAAKAADGELASAIKVLKKPSVAAWAVNVLARERPKLVTEVVAMGRAFLDAQDASDGAAIRGLNADRRTLLARVVTEAKDVAKEHGETLGPQALAGLDTTLRAAMADADAAQAVRDGRLIAAIEAPGIGGVDLSDVVAIPGEPREQDEGEPSGADEERRHAAERRRFEQKARRAAVQEAEDELADASTEKKKLQREKSENETAIEKLQKEIHQLGLKADSLEKSLERAERAEDEAAQRVTKAKEALDELS